MVGRTHQSQLSAGFRFGHRLWFGILLIFVCSAVYAQQAGNGSLSVAIRDRTTHDSIKKVYVGLVAIDQPAYRPTYEGVIDGTVKWPDVPAGRYTLFIETEGFNPTVRTVEMAGGKSSQFTVDLEPQYELTGTVVDAAGNPIKGATVSYPRVLPPRLIGVMSAMELQNAKHLRASADENGAWKLGVPVKETPLLVEAPGYEAVWVTWDPKNAQMPPVTLKRGSSLRVVTNRPAPDVILALVPTTRVETSIPWTWQERLWAREAEATAVEWTSMPAGEYELKATWPEAKRFKQPVTLQHVTLSGTDIQEVKVTLPGEPPPAAKFVRVRVPWKTETRDLHAFVRTSSGYKEVRAASENGTAAKILYADTDAPSENVFFTSEAEVIVAGHRALTAQNDERSPAAEGSTFPKAEGTLKVSVPDRVPLPTHGDARFDECQGDRGFVLPVNVAKSGDVALPLLVGCRALGLRFENYSPVVVRSVARVHERVWLGAHHLKTAASARVHVVHQSDGSSAPDAIVTASVSRGSSSDELVPVAKGVAGPDGWLAMDGLPVGEDITFRAEDASKLAGKTNRTLDPGKREVIDPLPLPEAGSLTVDPKLEDAFKSENPSAEIVGIAVQPAEGGTKADMRSVDLTHDQQEAVFAGLAPGVWGVIGLVRIEGLTQPLDVTMVTIESGDKKKIEPLLDPMVVAGHLLSHGHGVKAGIGLTDPPGPSAISRRVFSKADGAFKVVLPRPGLYTVVARRVLTDPDSDLGPIQFDRSSKDVRLELPEGSLAVRVFSGGMPASDVQVTAALVSDNAQSNDLIRLNRIAKTDVSGQTLLDDMQNGSWLVRARGKDDTVAEKAVAVSVDHPASVTLDLDGGATLAGSITDGAGNPVGMANVNCIYSGSDRIPRGGAAEADSWGKFSIHFPNPAPEQVHCGVTAFDGTIATFATAPTSDAQFVLPLATGSVTIANWTDRGNQDRYWLVSADGGAFDLTWAALKFRRFDAPFTLPRVPAGAWAVVRIDSTAAFDAVARGAAASLPKIGQIRVAPGEHQQISMSSGSTAGSR